jgi:exosortase O
MQTSTLSPLHQALPNSLMRTLNLAIACCWLWLYWPMFGYLVGIYQFEEFRTSQLITIGVIGLIMYRMRHARVQLRLDTPPHIYPPALLFALGCSLCYILLARFVDVNLGEAVFFGIASYGLLGLWMAPRAWRNGLPPALLLIGALPLGEFAQVLIGYPMRIVTARLVGEGFAAAGFGGVGVDTILIFENGVSQVDLPCSGVKSLWTGGLFLLAITWVEGRRIGPRWLLVALSFAALLCTTNLLRVAVLVGVGEIAGWRFFAEMLHVPLGVLGFIVACGAALLMARRLPEHRTQSAERLEPRTENRELRTASMPLRPRWLAPVLVAVMATFALGYASRPVAVAQAGPAQSWRLPSELNPEPFELRPNELNWLISDGAESVERARFNWRGYTGTLLLVTSRTRRAHHNPERCFENYGLTIEHSTAHLVDESMPIRRLTLSNEREGGGKLTANYWFQSADRITDDYGARFWASVSLEQERWVLVSILFDEPQAENDPALTKFYQLLRATVGEHLEAEFRMQNAEVRRSAMHRLVRFEHAGR